MITTESGTIPDLVISELRSRRPIVVAENGACELVMLASEASVSATAFLIRHGSGFVVAVLDAARLAQLEVPKMVAQDGDSPPFYVSVDAAEGITTGISAYDRARTLSVLADPESQPTALIRPGHVVPACVDLSRPPSGQAHHRGAAMVCAIATGAGAVAATVALESVCTTGTATPDEGRSFAREHRLAFLHGRDITALWYRQHTIGMEPTIGG